MTSFDPYYKWLGIPVDEQPANHYRLLGITLFERDPEVIEAAADRQMKYVSQCAIGEHLKVSQRLMNELSAARVCLLVAAKKSAYDAELRKKLDESRQIEASLVPVMLDEPQPASVPRQSSSVPRTPRLRRSGSKSVTRRKADSRRASLWAMPVGVAVAIVVLVCGRIFRPSKESQLPPTSTAIANPRLTVDRQMVVPPEPDSPEMIESRPLETASTSIARPDAVVAEVKPPVGIEPMQQDQKKQDDSRKIEEFGTSFVTTKGNAVGAVIEGSEGFSPSDTFTIEFWVSTLANRGTLISKRHVDREPSVIVHLDNGIPNLSIAIGGGERGSGGGPPINDGQWHHLAMVKKMDRLTLYVDGHRTVQTTESTSMVSPSPWAYGCSYNRTPCAARFGGLRISNAARYDGPFEPKMRYPIDADTLLQP